MVKAIPEGYTSITTHLICRDCASAIDWYTKVFGAEDLGRMMMPDSDIIMHASIKIGDSHVMFAEENPEWGAMSPLSLEGSPVTIHLYVEDADAVYAKAVENGANGVMPVMDAFWGDRYGKVVDPFGHHWSIATHVRDVSPEEMAKAAVEQFSNAG